MRRSLRKRLSGWDVEVPSPIYRLVWDAIRERQHVLFEYDGRRRDVCPIILGYSATGREALKAYQVGGETSSGHLPAWRDFYLDRIKALRLDSGSWVEGSSHKQPQSFVKFVDVDVNIPDTLTRVEPLSFGSPLLRPPRKGR
jgi:predicted DNA-binding transcriptional regulator YafY